MKLFLCATYSIRVASHKSLLFFSFFFIFPRLLFEWILNSRESSLATNFAFWRLWRAKMLSILKPWTILCVLSIFFCLCVKAEAAWSLALTRHVFKLQNRFTTLKSSMFGIYIHITLNFSYTQSVVDEDEDVDVDDFAIALYKCINETNEAHTHIHKSKYTHIAKSINFIREAIYFKSYLLKRLDPFKYHPWLIKQFQCNWILFYTQYTAYSEYILYTHRALYTKFPSTNPSILFKMHSGVCIQKSSNHNNNNNNHTRTRYIIYVSTILQYNIAIRI